MDLTSEVTSLDLEMLRSDTARPVLISNPLVRSGSIEMHLIVSSAEDLGLFQADVVEASRTITLIGSDPWPASLRKGTPVEISASIAGMYCKIEGTVTKRYARKLVIEGTIEMAQ